MLPVFRTIEDNELGASDLRGAGGPLHVSTVDGGDPLLEDVIGAGAGLGWRRAPDFNETDEERIGYTMATIHDGRRSSAATAFLHPVSDRPNLTVALHTAVDRVLLEGGRAVGVQGRRNGQAFEARATREVILATGAIVTPKILQLSGIGPADTLRSAGVDVAVDSPNVGGRLREHRVFRLQFRLAEDLGYNKVLGTESGQQAAAEQYQATRSGRLARTCVRPCRVLQDPPRPRAPRRAVPAGAVLGPAARTRQVPAARAGAGRDVRRPTSCGRTAKAASRSPRRIPTRPWTSIPTTSPPSTIARRRSASSAACAGCSPPSRSRRGSCTRRFPGRECKGIRRSSTPAWTWAVVAITPSGPARWGRTTTTWSTRGCGCAG